MPTEELFGAYHFLLEAAGVTAKDSFDFTATVQPQKSAFFYPLCRWREKKVAGLTLTVGMTNGSMCFPQTGVPNLPPRMAEAACAATVIWFMGWPRSIWAAISFCRPEPTDKTFHM